MDEVIDGMDMDGMDMDGMDGVELPSDPDAQATITDFTDFTEYLPSDMTRSLTLIGNLDSKYARTNSKLGELSKIYGQLPTLAATKRPEPSRLRADISDNLNRAVDIRTLAQAEAYRMAANVDRHYQKLIYIESKLEALFEAFPTAQEELAAATHSISPLATRTPKITLRLGEYSAHKGPRVKRGPRITVPGEVLAPNEFDWDTYDSESDISETLDDELATPRPIQRRASSSGPKRIKLKVPKTKKVEKTPKPPRPPRAPGVMGTNVHSQVAGISTSNALAKLKPPPDDAPIGSEHRPWGRLTQFELAKLRKRMKKNAVWQPSTTMINRELNQLERSLSHYRAAKAEAEAADRPFDGTWESSGNAAIPSGGAPPEEPLEEPEDLPIVNKGMKLNEQKKAKKESLAKLAAVEAEESARKMAVAARVMRGLFDKVPANGASKGNGKSLTETTPSKPVPRKRKRDSTSETEAIKADSDTSKTAAAITPATPAVVLSSTAPTTAPTSVAPTAKRAKTETPVPPPPSSAGSRIIIPQSAIKTRATTEVSPAAEPTASASTSITTTAAATSVPVRPSSPRKSSTPILPPTKEKKTLIVDAKKPAVVPTLSPVPALMPTRTRSHRSTTKTPTPAPEAITEPIPAAAPAPTTGRRPPSRGKAASVEPGAPSLRRDRPRRASTVHNTPAPEIPVTRPPSRRAKRPAPGPVTAGEEGSAPISVGKRTAAPRKKAAGKKGQKDEAVTAIQEPDIEVDENGVPIDPSEPRYCTCNRVSYGEMIACENNQVCFS
jgi:hypothetical protein